MNKQLSALPDSKTTRIILPYKRQYVIFAVYEVLDKNGAEYEKTDASTILAEMSVYGNLSRFSVSVNEQETGTELTVTMIPTLLPSWILQAWSVLERPYRKLQRVLPPAVFFYSKC